MKKLIFIATFLISVATNILNGGAIGVQLGRVTFGIGGSCNGPIIGVGPSPDNGLPIAAPFVPDGCCYNECSSCNTCYQNDCDECY